MGAEADPSGYRLCGGWFGYREIRHIVAGPLRSVPPYPLLPFAPWIPGWIGRRAVIEEAPVGRPGVAPIQLGAALAGRIGLFTGREVLVRSRKDAGVDPVRTRRRAVIGQGGETGDVLGGVGTVVSVQLLQELLDVGLSDFLIPGVLTLKIEDQVPKSLIPGRLAIGIHLLQPLPQLIGEPHIGSTIAGRLRGLGV